MGDSARHSMLVVLLWICSLHIHIVGSCGTPPPVSHATVSLSTVNSLQIATYTCDAANGYATRGNNTIACLRVQGYAVWTSVTVSCPRVRCSTEPSMSQATRVKQRGSRNEYYYHYSYDRYVGYSRRRQLHRVVYFYRPMVPTYYTGSVVLTCNANYYLPNGTQSVQMYCGDDGKWITPSVSCQGRSCGNLPSMTGVTCSGSSNRYPATRYCQCISGYEKGGNNYFNLGCQSNGQWSQRYSCYKISCGSPPRVRLTSPDATRNTGTRYQDTTTYTCIPGYEVTSGSATITCQANKRWSSIPTCSKKNCGSAPKVENGNVTRQFYNTTFNSEVTYKCNEIGYNMLRSPTIRCSEDGTWTEPPICYKVNCGVPPAVQNAKMLATGHSYQDNATYQCDTGYEVMGNPTVHCLAYGHWSFPPICQALSCPDPPLLENSLNAVVTHGKTVGNSVEYICLPGYDITGDSIVECLPALEWSTLPSCNKIRCGSPYDVLNSQRQVSGHYLNDITVYTCLHGYQLYGNSTIYCQEDGHWSIPPECHSVSCGIPPSIDNGRIKSMTGFEIGKTIYYECVGGHFTSDLKFITCQLDGTWSQAPQCQPNIEATTSSTTSTTNPPSQAPGTNTMPNSPVFSQPQWTETTFNRPLEVTLPGAAKTTRKTFLEHVTTGQDVPVWRDVATTRMTIIENTETHLATSEYKTDKFTIRLKIDAEVEAQTSHPLPRTTSTLPETREWRSKVTTPLVVPLDSSLSQTNYKVFILETTSQTQQKAQKSTDSVQELDKVTPVIDDEERESPGSGSTSKERPELFTSGRHASLVKDEKSNHSRAIPITIGCLISLLVCLGALAAWIAVKRRRRRTHNLTSLTNALYESEGETMTVYSFKSRNNSMENLPDVQQNLIENSD